MFSYYKPMDPRGMVDRIYKGDYFGSGELMIIYAKMNFLFHNISIA